MNKERAKLIIESWNGEDARFLYEGEILTEDDVHYAQEYLDNYRDNKKVTMLIGFRVDDNSVVKNKLLDSVQCSAFRFFKEVPDDAEVFEKDPIYREKVAEYNKIKKEKEEYLKIKLQENHK